MSLTKFYLRKLVYHFYTRIMTETKEIVVKERSSKLKCPEFSGEEGEYEEWRVLAEDWIWITKDEVVGQGVVMRQGIKGKARRVVLDIKTDVIRGDKGAEEVIKKLDSVYRKEEVFETYARARDYLYIQRGRNEAIRDFLQRYDHTSYCCEREGGNVIQGNLRAVHLMEAAKLTDEQTQMVITGSGKEKLDFDTIRLVMKRMFESTEKGAKSEDNWVEGMRRMSVRNDFDNRGRKNVMRFGKVTRCAGCGSEYHWVRQCPQNGTGVKQYGVSTGQTRNEQGASKETTKQKEGEGNKVYVSNMEESELWSDIEGILDTGCKFSVIGQL